MPRPQDIQLTETCARRCIICGDVFGAPVRIGRPPSFCSTACKAKATPANTSRICIICNTTYDMRSPGAHPPFYCSLACQAIKTICKVCAAPTQNQWPACSKAHFDQFHPGPFQCLKCNTVFTDGTWSKVYCSKPCRKAYLNAHVSDEPTAATSTTGMYLKALQSFLQGSNDKPPVRPNGYPERRIQPSFLPAPDTLNLPGQMRLRFTLEWWQHLLANPPTTHSNFLAMIYADVGMRPPFDVFNGAQQPYTLNYVWPWFEDQLPKDTYEHMRTLIDWHRNAVARSIRYSREQLEEMVMLSHGYHNSGQLATDDRGYKRAVNFLKKWFTVKVPNIYDPDNGPMMSLLQRDCLNYLNARGDWPSWEDWAPQLAPAQVTKLKSTYFRLGEMADRFWVDGDWATKLPPPKEDRMYQAMRLIADGAYNRQPQ